VRFVVGTRFKICGRRSLAETADKKVWMIRNLISRGRVAALNGDHYWVLNGHSGHSSRIIRVKREIGEIVEFESRTIRKCDGNHGYRNRKHHEQF